MADQMTWKLSGLFHADPNKVSDEIHRIGDGATAEQIVEAAKEESSELHKCFEWDDAKAGYQYRLHQARVIMQNLVFIPPEPAQPKIREYQFIPSQTRYEPTKVIVRNIDKYQELLMCAKSELAAFKRKYSILTELTELFEEIDRFIA